MTNLTQLEESLIEEFEQRFAEINVYEAGYSQDGEPDNAVIIDAKGMTRHTLAEVKSFFASSLSRYKEGVAEDLVRICNTSKTERGLARAIGNFIKALR